MEDKVVFYKGKRGLDHEAVICCTTEINRNAVIYWYEIQHIPIRDTTPICPNTITIKNHLTELIDSLTYKYWEIYVLSNMEFDESLTEEEVTSIKTIYNEFYLELNPNAILIFPTSSDPQIISEITAFYHTNGGGKGKSTLNLYCSHDDHTVISSGSTGLIKFGIACEAGQSFWLMSNSDISQTPLRLSCGVSIIDRNYRGELTVRVDNTGCADYRITPGETLFQIALPDLREIRPVMTTFLKDRSC